MYKYMRVSLYVTHLILCRLMDIGDWSLTFIVQMRKEYTINIETKLVNRTAQAIIKTIRGCSTGIVYALSAYYM